MSDLPAPRDHRGRRVLVVALTVPRLATNGGFEDLHPTSPWPVRMRGAVIDRLAREGAQVWLVSPSEAELGFRCHRRVLTGRSLWSPGNGASAAEAFTAAREAMGRIDAVLVDANLDPPDVALGDLDDERAQQLVAEGVLGIVVNLREAARAVADGGSICVAVPADADLVGASRPTEAVAAASAMALVRTMAVELSDRKVCVTALCSGWRGDAVTGAVEQRRPALMATGSQPTVAPKGTLGELASLASFLLGTDASFCSGGVFTMDCRGS